MRTSTKVSLFAAACVAVTAGGGLVGVALADRSELPAMTMYYAPEAASTKADATFVIGCLSMRPTPANCYEGRWEVALKNIKVATRNNPEVKATCKTTKGAWRTGYCKLVEDDNTKWSLQESGLGIIARARLAR
jgi:hypothetical protein